MLKILLASFADNLAVQNCLAGQFNIQLERNMGIDGLLRNIRNCVKKRSIEQYSGMTAAVDTYAWLHKIIKGPSGKEIIIGKNVTKYVEDCMKRIYKLRQAGVDVIMVFDGGPLPRKAGEEQTRKKRREQNERKGLELVSQGQVDAGTRKLQDAIDITPDVAYQLILQLKKWKIRFVVAPYEADAQLAYLNRTGQADFILTQDGDLLVFGAKRVLYKFDFTTLNGEEICLDQIRNSKDGLCFQWFTHCMFMTICIMAGCDYLAQISGIGLKTAHRYISRLSTLKNALGEISSSGKQIPQNYEFNFILAFLTFRFQRVYCPILKKCVQINNFEILNSNTQDLPRLKELNWSQEVIDSYVLQYTKAKKFNWDFLGPKLTDETARMIGEAQINPITFEAYNHYPFDNLNYSQQIKQLSLNNKKRKLIAPPSAVENRLIVQFCQMGVRNIKTGSSVQIRQLKTHQQNCLDYEDQQSRSNHFEEQFKANQIRPRQSIIKKKRKALNINQSQQEFCQDVECDESDSRQRQLSEVINLSDDSEGRDLTLFTKNNNHNEKQFNQYLIPNHQNYSHWDATNSKIAAITKPMFDQEYFTNPFTFMIKVQEGRC